MGDNRSHIGHLYLDLLERREEGEGANTVDHRTEGQ